ncbi:MAG: porin family protein [Flavobacteriaceae bacterium]|nr:porin family protein [Flavobacteriaceae bacterium]
MKKLVLIVFTALLSTATFAQGVDFGIKAGANFATLTDASGLDNKTGFVIGVFGGIKFNDNIAIQADLLYSQQGADPKIGDLDLDYVNVPVVLRYFVFKGLNLQAGPQFGFIVEDSDIDAESFDLTGVAGVGYDLPMGIRLAARYNFGLTDVVKDSGSKNSVFNLSVGYSFL